MRHIIKGKKGVRGELEDVIELQGSEVKLNTGCRISASAHTSKENRKKNFT